MNRFVEILQILPIKPNLAMSSCRLDLLQQAHHDFLTEQGGQDGNTNVQLPPMPILSLMRPSWSRRSAISKPAMTFKRDTRAFFSRSGGLIVISCSTPSIRNRTQRFFRRARNDIAAATFCRIGREFALTRVTTGASMVACCNSWRLTSSLPEQPPSRRHRTFSAHVITTPPKR